MTRRVSYIGLVLLVSMLMIFSIFSTNGAVDEGTRAPTELSGLPDDDSDTYNYVTLADVNEDGYLDVITGSGGYNDPPSSPGGLYVFLNNNGNSFSSASTGLPGVGEDYFGSIQVIDLNKDSNLDIVAAYESRWSGGNSNGIGIWFGNGGSGGSMSWTEATSPKDSGSFDSIAVADIDNDGNVDIVGASSDGLYAWEGSHSGSTLSWTEVSTGLNVFRGEATGITLGDINNDGRLDIVAGSYNSKGISIYLCSSSGVVSWTEGHSGTNLKTSGNSFDMYLTDLNSDSNLDLIASFQNAGLRAYLGNGNKGNRNTWWNDVSTGLPTSGNNYQIAVGDVNNDGKLNIGSSYNVWSNSGEMPNSGSYSWAKLDLGISDPSGTPIGIDLGDLNNDGSLDLVGCGWGFGVSAYTLTALPPTEYNLHGIVTDSTDSTPLSGATVRIDTKGIDTKTTSTGGYEFDVISGKYELTVTMQGYKSAKKIVEVSSSDIAVNFQLLPVSEVPEAEFEVSGTVKDDNGQAIADVSVSLEPGGYSTTTNDLGKYAFQVPNGSYIITIQKSAYDTESANVEVSGAVVVKDIALQSTTTDGTDGTDGADGDDDKDKDDKKDTPGFEIVAIIGAALLILVFTRRRRK